MVTDLNDDYHSIEFICISISCRGIFGRSSELFFKMPIGNHYFQTIYHCQSHDILYMLYEKQTMGQPRPSHLLIMLTVILKESVLSYIFCVYFDFIVII